MTSDLSTAEEPVYFEDVTDGETSTPAALRKRNIMSLPVSIDVIIGSARLTIDELLRATPDTVISLDARIDEPVVLKIRDRIIAHAELLELDEEPNRLAVKITEIFGDISA